MKKLLLVMVMAAALAVNVIPNAGATIRGSNCKDHSHGAYDRTVCVDINQHDTLRWKLEGLLDTKASPYSSDIVDIQIDFIHLWECNASGSSCSLVAYASAYGYPYVWYCMDGRVHTNPTCHPSDVDPPGSFSTTWYNDLCSKYYHAEAKYRMRWPNGDIGQWFDRNSNDWQAQIC